ncbi:cysteine proteinase inhibitor 1-like [Tripterygium wilfordii]|uniref:Cysteine proteinase inhibitor 1-like n=1 Tax=Tripterygium wilfordii TaxID=458696 RepID=A0A7J7CGH9_TRIWF|nr:cysteine proteinase inhibitor 1-like [Tripterygium wilfordii]
MKSQVYLLIFTLAIAITATVSKSQPVGGYFPIKDLEDPYVIGIAEFAISEYNKMAMTNLELISILKGNRASKTHTRDSTKSKQQAVHLLED